MFTAKVFLPLIRKNVAAVIQNASLLNFSRLLSSDLNSSATILPLKTQIHRRQCNYFHMSSKLNGLEEFFDNPENFGKYKLTTGMAWSLDLLRRKSTEDLQKLWFVLLKERNMLNTLEQYCIDEDEPLPGPDRIEKVAESMSNLRDVLEEREKAKNMLLHGTHDGIGGEWRKSPLGAVYFYKYREHLIPKELQEIKRGDRPVDLAYFNFKLEEWHLRMEEKRRKKRGGYKSLIASKYEQIRARNRNLPKKMPMWWKRKFKTKWLYGIHPQMRIFMKHHDKDSRIITKRPRQY